VSALEIGAELHLVDGQERDLEIARHGLDGGDPITRAGRLDLLLAGNEGNRIRAGTRRDLVVNLARQQPQRQPDDARRMGEHAFDGEMGLAGIGRTEHRGHTGTARAGIAAHGRGEGNWHR
jgi:hypothetical protein